MPPVWRWKCDAPAPVLAAGGAGSLKAEQCRSPPCTCCALLRGASLCAPPLSRACVRTCVLVRVHLTDLKQVCKTRLPPRLKGSRAARDLGGRGKATSVQNQTVPPAKWPRKLLRAGSWVETPTLGMFCLEELGSEVGVRGGSHILRRSHIWGSRLAGADGSPSALGFNDSWCRKKWPCNGHSMLGHGARVLPPHRPVFSPPAGDQHLPLPHRPGQGRLEPLVPSGRAQGICRLRQGVLLVGGQAFVLRLLYPSPAQGQRGLSLREVGWGMHKADLLHVIAGGRTAP